MKEVKTHKAWIRQIYASKKKLKKSKNSGNWELKMNKNK